MRTVSKTLVAAFGAMLLLTTGRTARANEATSAATPLAASSPAAAQAEDKWTFTSPTFFWLSGLDGNVTLAGHKADVSFSPGDIVNHTEFGYLAYLDFNKQRFGFYALPMYLKLSADGVTPGGAHVDFEQRLWVAELGARYQVWVREGDRPGAVSILAGLRYWNMHNTLSVQGVGDFARTTTMYDPIIGLRYEQYLTRKWHVWCQGDIGGFDLGRDTSRFSWQLTPLIGYDFTMPVIKKPSTVFGGYRVLATEHMENGGTANERGFNVKMHGVILGLNVELF